MLLAQYITGNTYDDPDHLKDMGYDFGLDRLQTEYISWSAVVSKTKKWIRGNEKRLLIMADNRAEEEPPKTYKTKKSFENFR